MEQLANIFLEIERHPYDKIGLPLPQGGKGSTRTTIARYALPQLFDSAGVSPPGPVQLGQGCARGHGQSPAAHQQRQGEYSALGQSSHEMPEARNDTRTVFNSHY